MAGPKPGGGPRGTGSGPACGIALPRPLWQGQRRGVKDWFRTERKSKKKMKRKPKLAGRAIGPGKRGRTGCGGPALVFRKTGTYTRAELLLRTLSGMSPAEGLAAPAGRQHATAKPHARGPSRGSWGPERGRRARQVRGIARWRARFGIRRVGHRGADAAMDASGAERRRADRRILLEPARPGRPF